MKKTCFLIICLILGVSAFSQVDTTFKSANNSYSNGNYTQALASYNQILQKGQTSANLYFNLANAHYKLGHIPESIFYYEKALQLDPNDQDIQNNLKFANKRTIDAIDTKEKTGLSKMVQSLLYSYTVHTWAWIAIVFAFGFGIFYLVYSFSQRLYLQRLFFTIMFICAILSAVSVYFAFQQNAYYEEQKFGIVFKKQIDVRAEPNPGSDLAFELHEGTKVQVIEDFNGYFKIELADGQIGWIKTGAIKTLNRRQI